MEDVWGLVRANDGHMSFVALKELWRLGGGSRGC